MPFDRRWYVDTVRHWMAALEDRWDERLGYYRIPQSARANGMLIPPMLVLVGEGEEHWKGRIRRIAERMVQSPPYDERYHYFNWNMSQTGGEIHQAGCMTQVGLSFVLRYGEVLELPSERRAEIARTVHDSLERLAEFGRHAEESEFGMAVEEDGTPVNIAQERAEKIAKGLPENFGRLRQIGPDNQACWEMRACVYAWRATGDKDYLDFADWAWRRVLRKEGHLPYRACFSEDWSFIYHPGNRLWNYTQAMYDVGMYCQYADAVRVLREAGRSRDAIERFMKHWGEAVFTRSFLSDGSSNMVFNTYGWERSVVGCTHGMIFWMHPVIAVADLTPYDAGALKAIFERGVERLRTWDFRYPFSPDLGIQGWTSAQEEDRTFFPYELGLMLLDHPEVVDVESVPYTGCLSSLAWKEGNVVMQTPMYHATVIGTSPGYNGLHGIPMSGGEFVIRLPHGDYLFPLSDHGRTSLGAVAEGQAIHSAELTKYTAGEWHFEMAVRLPDGTRLSRGSAYGPLLYDPKMEGIALEVAFGNDAIQLAREIVFGLDYLVVTDRLTALREVRVDRAYSRIPLITVNSHHELPEITGTADGKGLCIRPPYYMGLTDADYLHHDQEYVQSLRRLEVLRVVYPHYGFEVRQSSKEEIRLVITPWEWQENRRMRVDGKNLDYLWIWEPVNLKKGESRVFGYELRPHSQGLKPESEGTQARAECSGSKE